MTPKKGVSIGAAMKQRMGVQRENDQPEDVPAIDTPSTVQKLTNARTRTIKAVPHDEDPLESFNTRLPRSLQRRLKIHVAVNNVKIQDVIQEALETYLGKKES